MNTKQIVFTAIGKAELLDMDCPAPKTDEVTVRMAYTAISSGTERANISGDINVDASSAPTDTKPHFPRMLGYSGSGIIHAVGKNVKHLKKGDRVVVTACYHKGYCNVPATKVFPIESETVSLEQAAFSYIASFSTAAIRKTRLEMGESCVVMGLGILGLFAVKFARAAGAFPVIAVDPVESRREFALKVGADYALDPNDPQFVDTVKSLTNGGANTAIEVSGFGKALDQVLDCMARLGRVALLGCTRDANFTIDYYRKVHYPGITLVGAHTGARPGESRPGYWTSQDDIYTILHLLQGNRVSFADMVCEIHSPYNAQTVYTRLMNDRQFPVGVLFDWGQVNG
ncbi:MAG: zinc-binding dehydrogenase [Clostridia bacterium]|nr:zinc-binding dehydrogenase [Clostridia bacterium]